MHIYENLIQRVIYVVCNFTDYAMYSIESLSDHLDEIDDMQRWIEYKFALGGHYAQNNFINW